MNEETVKIFIQNTPGLRQQDKEELLRMARAADLKGEFSRLSKLNDYHLTAP